MLPEERESVGPGCNTATHAGDLEAWQKMKLKKLSKRKKRAAQQGGREAL